MGLASPGTGTDMSARIVNDVSESRKFQTNASKPDLFVDYFIFDLQEYVSYYISRCKYIRTVADSS